MQHETENNHSVFRRALGQRLREERTRLALRQADVAALLATTEQTLRAWEAGKTAPDAFQLAELADSGVDTQYVVTGERRAQVSQLVTIGPNGTHYGLPPEEAALLALYREASPVIQQAATAVLHTALDT